MAKVTTSGGKTVRSPISSMRDSFRSLKNNLKSMSKSVLGVQDELEKSNRLKEKELQLIKDDAAKYRDLVKKQSEESRLEKSNLVGDTFANIGKSIKKTGGNILSKVLNIMGLFAGAWLLKNAGNIMETIQGGIDFIVGVWNKIGNAVGGTMDFVKGLGGLVIAFGQNILSFDFADSSDKIKDAFSDIELSWQRLNGDITGAERVLDNPEKEFEQELNGGIDDSSIEDSETRLPKPNNDENNTGNRISSNSEKVDPFVVLEDNRDLFPPAFYEQVKETIEKNPSAYDTKEEINAAISALPFAPDPSQIRYRDNYNNVNNEDTLENKQLSLTDKVHQQVNAAGQKIKNEDLRIEGQNNTEQKLAMIIPKLKPQEITVIDNSPQQVNVNGSSEGGNVVISGGSDELNSIEQLMLQDLTYT